MITMFEGNSVAPIAPRSSVGERENRRMMKYCYTLSTADGEIIYNCLTGHTVLLPDGDVQAFMQTDYAVNHSFSVPLDFKEDPQWFGCAAETDPETVQEMIRSLYAAYKREVAIDEKRRKLYTKENTDRWLQAFGSPLYVFRKDDFTEAYRHLEAIFQKEYPKYRVAYSYKTNYVPKICKAVQQLGGYAEVVSEFELNIARSLGYRDSEIIYNGPCKGDSIETFLLNHGILNIDSFDELEAVCNVADRHPEAEISFGIRLNLMISQDWPSRFGIDADEESMDAILCEVSRRSNLRIAGLHFHSGELTLESWRTRAGHMLEVIDKYFPVGLTYIDLGSGMRVRGFYDKSLPKTEDIRSLERYAATALRPFAAYYQDRAMEEKPLLFTEPGTILIKDCVDFLSTVQTVKQNQGKTYIIADASKAQLGSESYIDRRPLMVIDTSLKKKRVENAAIVGYTCMESDQLYVGFSGQIGKGDRLVFGDVGAYSLVEKPPFIRPGCAMIEIDGQREMLIKEAESDEDLLRTYVFDETGGRND